MEDNLSNFKHLLEERENARREYNQYIIDFVSDTVGVAVQNLLNLPATRIEWEDIQVSGPAALFTCVITYNPAAEPSEFLQLVDQFQPGDSPIDLQRILQIGVPLTLLFSPHAVLTQFLLDVARGVDPVDAYTTAKAASPEVEQKQEHLDVNETIRGLSEEQIQQMLFFQQTTKGKLQ